MIIIIYIYICIQYIYICIYTHVIICMHVFIHIHIMAVYILMASQQKKSDRPKKGCEFKELWFFTTYPDGISWFTKPKKNMKKTSFDYT